MKAGPSPGVGRGGGPALGRRGSREALIRWPVVSTRNALPCCHECPGGDGDGWIRLVNDEIRCRTIRLGPVSEQQVGQWANRFGIELTSAQAAGCTGTRAVIRSTSRPCFTELTRDQLTSSTHELPAPRSLASATIGALAELPEDANQLVSALAVLGQRTPLAVVARVAGVAEPAVALETCSRLASFSGFRRAEIRRSTSWIRSIGSRCTTTSRRRGVSRSSLGRGESRSCRWLAAPGCGGRQRRRRLADELDTGRRTR